LAKHLPSIQQIWRFKPFHELIQYRRKPVKCLLPFAVGPPISSKACRRSKLPHQRALFAGDRECPVKADLGAGDVRPWGCQQKLALRPV
jgi:hypothetical protein